MRRLAFAALMTFGFAAAAVAQEGAEAPGSDPAGLPTFKEVDTNGDGRVNLEESQSVAGFDFPGADANADRMLTRQEFAAAMESLAASGGGQRRLADTRGRPLTFEQADRNGDGKIDRDEAADLDGFDFAAADADNDRELDRAEFSTAMSDARSRG